MSNSRSSPVLVDDTLRKHGVLVDLRRALGLAGLVVPPAMVQLAHDGDEEDNKLGANVSDLTATHVLLDWLEEQGVTQPWMRLPPDDGTMTVFERCNAIAQWRFGAKVIRGVIGKTLAAGHLVSYGSAVLVDLTVDRINVADHQLNARVFGTLTEAGVHDLRYYRTPNGRGMVAAGTTRTINAGAAALYVPMMANGAGRPMADVHLMKHAKVTIEGDGPLEVGAHVIANIEGTCDHGW